MKACHLLQYWRGWDGIKGSSEEEEGSLVVRSSCLANTSLISCKTVITADPMLLLALQAVLSLKLQVVVHATSSFLPHLHTRNEVMEMAAGRKGLLNTDLNPTKRDGVMKQE